MQSLHIVDGMHIFSVFFLINLFTIQESQETNWPIVYKLTMLIACSLLKWTVAHEEQLLDKVLAIFASQKNE